MLMQGSVDTASRGRWLARWSVLVSLHSTWSWAVPSGVPLWFHHSARVIPLWLHHSTCIICLGHSTWVILIGPFRLGLSAWVIPLGSFRSPPLVPTSKSPRLRYAAERLLWHTYNSLCTRWLSRTLGRSILDLGFRL